LFLFRADVIHLTVHSFVDTIPLTIPGDIS
jgi:hypothetical protein